MPCRVAINGLGRIGRALLKILHVTPEFELVAVNDIAPSDNLAYLLRYDSVYGRHKDHVGHSDSTLIIGSKHYKVLSEDNPERLPWAEMDIDFVFECTGIFTRKSDLEMHLRAGARHVILSAPAKGDGDVPFVIHGVNDAGSANIISTASCTTNCVAPVLEVIGRRIGVEKAVMTTVHGYTVSQGLVDQPARKWRRGRAAAENLVPSSTGAAKATAKVLPQLRDRFDGAAIRVPIPCGSISDVTILTKRRTSVDEVNHVLKEEAESDRYEGILGVTHDPVVSSDIIMDARAAIVDLEMTQVVDGDLVKIMAWYDNEWGYAAQMVREASRMNRAR
jgi:glyceraldehyde 3-phosphate dehydrogenase